MVKKQFRLIGAWSLIVLSACNSEHKDGLADTYTSGVTATTADESFRLIVQEGIDVFEGLFPSAEIVPRYTTEVDAVNQFLKGSVRLATTTRTLTPEEMNSLYSWKFFPREIKPATDGLALIVNRQNTDTLVSVCDIRRILTGRVHVRKEFCPTSKLGNIQLVFSSKDSSTIRLAVGSIYKGAPLSDKDVGALRADQQVTDYVVRTSGAIGVVGVNWLGDRSDTTSLSFRGETRVTSVNADDMATPQNSYEPYQAYLYCGNYPLAYPIYVSLSDPRNTLPRGFVSFLTSDRRQRIILKPGLIPATQPVRTVDVKDG